MKYFEETIPYPVDVEEEPIVASSKACMFLDDDE
jgi:hypothetical protein